MNTMNALVVSSPGNRNKAGWLNKQELTGDGGRRLLRLHAVALSRYQHMIRQRQHRRLGLLVDKLTAQRLPIEK